LESQRVRVLDFIFALAAAATGFRAAWCWRQSSKVPIDPGWSEPSGPGLPEPGEFAQQIIEWNAAATKAFDEAAALYRKAAWWTALAVGLAAVASIFGALS
jgi:hypothetical protein